MRVLRPILSSVVGLLCTLGCDEAGEAALEPLVSDSAGVRMVLNRGVSFERGAPEWRVSSRPQLIIGRSAGAREYLFDRIMGVARLSDGRWAIADMGSSEVRYYDAAGLHLASSGRRGEGPGEFRQIMALYRLAGDSLLVDDAYTRSHLLDASGNFLGAFPGSPFEERMQIVGAFGDGSLVARTTPPSPQRLGEPQSMWVEYRTAELRTLAGDVLEPTSNHTIARFEMLRLVPGWRGSSTTIRFDGRTYAAVMNNGVAVADPMAFEVLIFGRDGDVRTIIRAGDWAFHSITEADRERDRAEYVNQEGEGGGAASPQMLQQRRAIAEMFVYAPHMPAFSDMRVDETDSIWLREYVPNEPTVGSFIRAPVEASRWLVFDQDGVLIGRISLPPRFAPLSFGADFVAGIYRDEMEVEYVHSYSLERL